MTNDLSWMFKLAASALDEDVQVCARCDAELAPADGAVSLDRDRRTTTRVCDPCVSTWMADHPEQSIVRALDLVRRNRARRAVH